MKLYASASKEIPAFHVSREDAKSIFTDNERWNCPDCLETQKKAEWHDGRVIVSNEPNEGLHLIGLSNA